MGSNEVGFHHTPSYEQILLRQVRILNNVEIDNNLTIIETVIEDDVDEFLLN